MNDVNAVPSPAVNADVAPLSLGTLRALGSGVVRELGWGLVGVSREVRRWRTLAEQIPDPILRADAVGSLANKRYFTDGAALFWTLPSRRDEELLALLVAYQTIANYLDYASERGAAHRGTCGESLMYALSDALDVDAPLHDYYADHPWTDDGGYLRELVVSCRRNCAQLPHYRHVRSLLIREGLRGHSLDLTHDPDPVRRDKVLEAFATREYPSITDVTWFELAGGASSVLTVMVLAALAADETIIDDDLHAALDVYCRWVCPVALMLDAYIDQAGDAEHDNWSAIAYYPDQLSARLRVDFLIDRALREVAQLRHGQRHTLIVATMIAMYLTSDSATAAPIAASTRRFRHAGGTLTRSLVPVLRCWRLLYRQRL